MKLDGKILEECDGLGEKEIESSQRRFLPNHLDLHRWLFFSNHRCQLLPRLPRLRSSSWLRRFKSETTGLCPDFLFFPSHAARFFLFSFVARLQRKRMLRDSSNTVYLVERK